MSFITIFACIFRAVGLSTALVNFFYSKLINNLQIWLQAFRASIIEDMINVLNSNCICQAFLSHFFFSPIIAFHSVPLNSMLSDEFIMFFRNNFWEFNFILEASDLMPFFELHWCSLFSIWYESPLVYSSTRAVFWLCWLYSLYAIFFHQYFRQEFLMSFDLSPYYWNCCLWMFLQNFLNAAFIIVIFEDLMPFIFILSCCVISYRLSS